MEIFSSSFLFSIAIIIILSGVLFAYLNYRMLEQDHKLNSMLGLISSMATETQFCRAKIQAIQQHIDLSNVNSDNIHNITVNPNEFNVQDGGMVKNLISVSDGEEDDDEDDDDYEEDEDDEYDEEDEEEGEDEEDEEDLNVMEISNEEITNNNIIKVITLSDDNKQSTQHDNIINIKSINLESSDDNGLLMSNNLIEELIPENSSFLNTLSLNDLGDTEDVHSSKNDYKKMPINKLREVVLSKGLTTDASKLKKNEILKMLGEE